MNLSKQLLLGIVLLCTLTSCRKDEPVLIILEYEMEAITIENFRSTNSGSDWDPIINTAPDIFVQLKMDQSVEVTTESVPNADASKDYTFNVNFRFPVEKLGADFQIQLIDNDELTADELMETFSFKLTDEAEQIFSDGNFEFSIKLKAITE